VEFIILPLYERGIKIDCSNYGGISLLPTTYKIVSNILLLRITPYIDERIISVDFNIIDELLVRHPAFVKCWTKWEYNYQLFVDLKKRKPMIQLGEKYCTTF
jgi:hypothetical protein